MNGGEWVGGNEKEGEKKGYGGRRGEAWGGEGWLVGNTAVTRGAALVIEAGVAR